MTTFRDWRGESITPYVIEESVDLVGSIPCLALVFMKKTRRGERRGGGREGQVRRRSARRRRTRDEG